MVAGAYLQHLNAPQQWHEMNLREKEGIKQLLYCLNVWLVKKNELIQYSKIKKQ